MNLKWVTIFATLLFFLTVGPLPAQDLGPGFHKVKDGIVFYAPDQTTTTCGIVTLLLKRVGDMAAQGKSLADIKRS